MNGQDLLECPYDKHHHILRNRMQVHLIKCRRNHRNVNKVICPFNVTHVLNEPELEMHVRECPERKTFESFVNAVEPVTSPTVPPPMPEVSSEENWDNEDSPTYNPLSYVEQASVLRNPQGVPPSERRRFRRQERLRFLENQE